MKTKDVKRGRPAPEAGDEGRKALTGYYPAALAKQIEEEAATHYYGMVSITLCKLAEEALAARREKQTA